MHIPKDERSKLDAKTRLVFLLAMVKMSLVIGFMIWCRKNL